MLKHRFLTPIEPDRVVIVGAGGFVGNAASNTLRARGTQVVNVARRDLDLLANDAATQLAAILRGSDRLVITAAMAPVKNNSMLVDNLRMMAAVCAALESTPVAHVVYVSSDAVYADTDKLLTEKSCAQPGSLHGIMHLAREAMLANTCAMPVCILRPTLIYGANDPHNGYGPNRFRRLAQRGEEIVLFGAGEERRDHVYVDDVAEIVARCVAQESEGILNVATGTVTSFRDIAEHITRMAPKKSAIIDTPRTAPMPHRGYRAFDAASTALAFPDFYYTALERGLALSQKQEFGDAEI